jgi:tetratricopeptide (TPR) repeat protein
MTIILDNGVRGRAVLRAMLVLAVMAGHAAAPMAGARLFAQVADAADAAWRAGETELAARLYEQRLQEDPRDPTALHRLALIRAGGNRFGESLALFDRLLAVRPDDVEARIDRARVLAWSGQPMRAVAALDTVLATQTGELGLLQARAQFAAWSGEYGASLPTHDRILALAPSLHDAQYERARVLARAARFPAAETAYTRILERSPDDAAALLGLAQVQAWSGQAEAATDTYDRVLLAQPRHLEARRGRTRAAAWGGDLVGAERRWREALAIAPAETESLLGLAQTLRWQGRDAAARELVLRVLAREPANAAASELLHSIESELGAVASPGARYAGDSGGNRVVTATGGAGWHPDPRFGLRGEGYYRNARFERPFVTVEHNTYGGMLTAVAQLEPGWIVSAGLGATSNDIVGAPVRRNLAAAIVTPTRHRAAASLALTRSTLDATARLIEWEVTATRAEATVSTMLPGELRLHGNAAFGHYEGGLTGQRNERRSGGFTVERAVLPTLSVALQAHAFGFEIADAGEGYFSPDFYGIAELGTRWRRERRTWALSLEAAPGIQQLRREGERSATVRAAAGAQYVLGPGRSVGVTAALENAALRSMVMLPATDYRYHSVGVTARWTF